MQRDLEHARSMRPLHHLSAYGVGGWGPDWGLHLAPGHVPNSEGTWTLAILNQQRTVGRDQIHRIYGFHTQACCLRHVSIMSQQAQPHGGAGTRTYD